MAILEIRPRDPSQARHAPVVITLCDVEGAQVDGFITATGEAIVKPYTGRTNAAGVLDVDLTPNADITPSQTGYRVTVAGVSVVIVKDATTQNLYEALAVGLGPLGPIVGAEGPPGGSGQGVPTGGSTGQVLTKLSAADFDDAWQTPAAGGVTSVSGTAPIASSGGATPAISITAATTGAAGSMSAADKTKLDGIATGATVGAPTDATYVTLTSNGTLSNERALTAGTGITLTDGGAGGAVTIAATGGAVGSIFGSGADGDVTISGTTTLTRDMAYNNLTVAPGGIIKTTGFLIQVKGTLSGSGTIENDGAGFGGYGAFNGSRSSGGPGGTAAGSAPGAHGSNRSFGGAGGAGGAGSGGAGGAGGVISAPAAVNFGQSALASLSSAPPQFFIDRVHSKAAAQNMLGGNGGGGGGGDGGAGADGGYGGGVTIVAARLSTFTGTISANGENGGNAGGTNRGGGGGGGGGLAVLITTSNGGPAVLSAAGGAGGSKTGTGVAGTAGTTGAAFVQVVA